MYNYNSNRAPIYHFTTPIRLINIIIEDILKKCRCSDKIEEAICLSRNKGFENFGCRITLNTEALIRDGYKPKPIDEYGNAVMAIIGKHAKQLKGYSKMNPIMNGNTVKNIHHNISSIQKVYNEKYKLLPTEYEERIYKSIPNLGKYIEYIDVDYLSHWDQESFCKYILKYPHITVRKLVYIETLSGETPIGDTNQVLLNYDVAKMILNNGDI